MNQRTDRRGACPRVSVIMPTYNRADLILQSIASVIAQSFEDWELLVVDDGSEDDTIARVDALGEPRIRMLAESHHGHVARLRNVGAKSARGSYLAFLDSDDLWLPQKLELQLQALAKTPGCWSYAAHELVDPVGRRMPLRAGRFEPRSGRITRALLVGETGAAIGTWLVPRPLFEQLGGFDESLSLREDFDFALRLSEAADAVALPDTLALVREHGARKTRSAPNQQLKTAIVFRRAAERTADPTLRTLARREHARFVASAGEAHLASGELSKGAWLLVRALAAGMPIRTWIRSAAAGPWRWLTKARRRGASPAP